MPDPLFVHASRRRVGRLDESPSGLLGFTYDAEWLASRDTTAISLCLPLRPQPYAPAEAHPWFANLLPEGAARERIARLLGLSADNDAALLRALGMDCAGALSISEDEAPPGDEDSYEELDGAELHALAHGKSDAFARIYRSMGRTRLSLAGAQDKLAALIDEDDRVWLPLHGAASTHLIKIARGEFAHLVMNEWFTTEVARRLGLLVPQVRGLQVGDSWVLVVERFDRVLTSEGARRIHQEDLCQATGRPRQQKYEAEGGPTLAELFAILDRHARIPARDADQAIRWAVANVVLGNSDGHGKNVALIHRNDRVDLAPFYDLVSTRAYDRLDPHLAMGIGGRRNADTLTRSHWREEALKLGLGPHAFVDTVEELAAQTQDAVAQAIDLLAPVRATPFVVQRIAPAMRARARSLSARLAQGR